MTYIYIYATLSPDFIIGLLRIVFAGVIRSRLVLGFYWPHVDRADRFRHDAARCGIAHPEEIKTVKIRFSSLQFRHRRVLDG